MLGKIKWFNNKTGSGFINCSDGEERYFDRARLEKDSSGNKPRVYAGDEVEFTLVDGGMIGSKVINKIILIKSTGLRGKVASIRAGANNE